MIAPRDSGVGLSDVCYCAVSAHLVQVGGGGGVVGGWLLMCGWRSCGVAGPISPAPSPHNAEAEGLGWGGGEGGLVIDVRMA